MSCESLLVSTYASHESEGERNISEQHERSVADARKMLASLLDLPHDLLVQEFSFVYHQRNQHSINESKLNPILVLATELVEVFSMFAGYLRLVRKMRS